MADYLSAEGFRSACKGNLEMLARLAAVKYCRGPVKMHRLQLAPAAIKQMEHHLHHLWELFDKAELVPTDDPAAAAQADGAFQRFLNEQCLKA